MTVQFRNIFLRLWTQLICLVTNFEYNTELFILIYIILSLKIKKKLKKFDHLEVLVFLNRSTCWCCRVFGLYQRRLTESYHDVKENGYECDYVDW